MLKYEDHCVGCPDGLPCLGSRCPNRNVPVYYCDECGEEMDEVYEDGDELCEECLKKRYRKVV